MKREIWLEEVASRLNTVFELAGTKIPNNIRYSCGFPSSRPNLAIGQCWDAGLSQGGNFEIFVSPYKSDSINVASILVHELIHAAVGTDKGHRKEFRRLAHAVGLEGRMTSTVPGTNLTKLLAEIMNEVGPYPHASLKKDETMKGSRLIKVMCPKCKYTVRVTKKWLSMGYPKCPDGELMKKEMPG